MYAPTPPPPLCDATPGLPARPGLSAPDPAPPEPLLMVGEPARPAAAASAGSSLRGKSMARMEYVVITTSYLEDRKQTHCQSSGAWRLMYYDPHQT